MGADFAGMLTRMVGDYKSMAVMLYAEECIRRDGLRMDATHYASRLNADLGASLGLNADEIRRGELGLSGRLSDPHSVLDEETMSRGCIDRTFALAMLEDVFLGSPSSCLDCEFNGSAIGVLFDVSPKERALWSARSVFLACRTM